MDTKIGVIGGSGVYQIDGLQDAQWLRSKPPLARHPMRC